MRESWMMIRNLNEIYIFYLFFWNVCNSLSNMLWIYYLYYILNSNACSNTAFLFIFYDIWFELKWKYISDVLEMHGLISYEKWDDLKLL